MRSSQGGHRDADIPVEGDAHSRSKGENGAVSQARDRSARFADKGRGLMASPRGDAVLALSLVLVGLAEVIARAEVGGLGAESALAATLLALGSTLPLALLGPFGAAVAICASSVLSLAGFHLLSLASFAAMLLALFRIGRGSNRDPFAQVSGLGITAPFLVLALIGPSPTSSESAVLTVLLAVLAPVAFLGGLALRARREVEENRAALPGHHRHPRRPHRTRRTGPHRPGASRRSRPPHLDGRGPGRGSSTRRSRTSGGRSSAALCDRGHGPRGACGDAPTAGRVA